MSIRQQAEDLALIECPKVLREAARVLPQRVQLGRAFLAGREAIRRGANQAGPHARCLAAIRTPAAFIGALRDSIAREPPPASFEAEGD